MRLKVGNYLFDHNAAGVSMRAHPQINKGGQHLSDKRTLGVTGWLTADGNTALSLAMSALATALAQPSPDVILYQNDGAESATSLKTAGSISGVRVIDGPHFPDWEGAEYVTYRKFEFTVEAEYPASNSSNLLLNFTEEIDFEGGKYPIVIHKLAINRPPQKQIVYPRDTFRAIQFGEAEGYRAYPTPPAPLWPKDLKRAPMIKRRTPQRMGNGYQGYVVTWRYEFESVNPLVGVPTLWK